MSSPVLTLAQVTADLYDTVVYSAVDPKFGKVLNQLCQRLIDSGEWGRSTFSTTITPVDGYVTLPRRASALLGIRFEDGRPRSVYPAAHEFSEVGPGEQKFDRGLRSVFELPDVCLQQDVPAAGSILSVVSTAAGDDGEVRIYGVGTDGRRLTSDGAEGLSLTLTGLTPVSTAVSVAKVDAIHLDVTEGFVVLTDADDTVLGTYEPGETNPSYRRYKVGTPPDGKDVEALCSRRHVPIVADTDLVFPANMGALKHGLIAMRLEESSDLQTSLAHFQQAYALLNNELRRLRGINRPTPMFRPNVRNIRSLY